MRPPQLRTYEVDDKEARGSGFTPPGGKSPPFHQSSDRRLFPEGITNSNLQSHKASCCSSSPSMLPRRKPWPSSSKARGSSISPQQGMEIGHAKASRVGVIDWGLLERWKYHQKVCQFKEGGEIAQKRCNSFELYFDAADAFPEEQSRCRSESSILQQLVEDEDRESTETGRNSCDHQSTFKEGSSQASRVDGNRENKGRRSPLRRMLDPFLKSKDNGQPFAAPDVPGCVPKKQAPNEDNESLTYSEFANMSLCLTEAATRNHQPRSNRHGAETRQAVLRFSRRNGASLFIFTSSDGDDVLAATSTKLNDEDMEELECVYTMFHIRDELKKRNGSRDKKSKKHHPASYLVGRMNVSLLRNHDDATREFVLLGTAESGTELAAIVVRIPEEMPPPAENASERSDSDDSASIVAILPRGIHGSSSESKPSPLLQRWRSGGACDCGGWDEGCGLTALTNEVWDNSNRDLFLRGGSGMNGHVFRMFSSVEGRMSRVEFGTSISWVQAFAICLAILHGGH